MSWDTAFSLNLLTFPSSPYFVAPIFLWGLICKERAPFILALILLGISLQLNIVLKEFFQIPLDPALKLTHTYGFPSGHMQSSSVIWGALAFWYGRPLITIGILAMLLLNGIAVHQLGFHTLLDILGGYYVALVLLYISFKIIPLIIPSTNLAVWRRDT